MRIELWKAFALFVVVEFVYQFVKLVWRGFRKRPAGERPPEGEASGYTRREFAAAVDAAHADLHTAAKLLDQLDSDDDVVQDLTAALDRAHDALHSVGGGLPRVNSATRDPEAQQICAELLDKLQTTTIPCGHELAELVYGEGGICHCGACVVARREAQQLETWKL